MAKKKPATSSHKKVAWAKAEKAPPAKPKVISVIELLKRTWLEISTFWRQLLGITAVYAALYFVFVLGFSITGSVQSQIDTSTSKLSQATATITSAFSGTYSGGQSDATVLVQMLLFVVAALAVVWALRKLQALKAITIRDSFYQGSAQIIPVILVGAVMIFTLLPAVLGSSVLTIVLQAGGAKPEVLIIGAIALLLLLLSALLFTMLWPAFYIASLPQTRPMQALRSSLAVTKKRRLSIMRKLIFLGLLVVIVSMLILLPFALLVPGIVQYVVYIVLFAVFMYSQVYLYELYRSLL